MNKILLTLVMLISATSLYGMDSTSDFAPTFVKGWSSDRSLCELQRTGKEVKNPSPMTLPQLYYHFSHDVFGSDIAQHILSLQCGDVTFEKIKQSSKYPDLLVNYIETLIPACGELLASEICEHYFKHAQISIYDIKDVHKQTSLHLTINRKVIQILLRVVGDNAFKLLTIQDDNGWTALHMAAYFSRIKIAKLFLNAAGKKASDLIKLKIENGKTALDLVCDKSEIKEVIQSYVTNNISI